MKWELVVCHWTDFISAIRGSVPALALFKFRDRKCRKGNISSFWKLSSLFHVAHSMEAKVFVALPVWLLRRKDKNMPKKILKEHQWAMVLPADKKNLQFFFSISYAVLLPHSLIFVFWTITVKYRKKQHWEIQWLHRITACPFKLQRSLSGISILGIVNSVWGWTREKCSQA